MQEKLFLKGVWFLPTNPAIKISGMLEFMPAAGITLQLMGIFPDTKRFDLIKGNAPIDIINGITTEGKLITLERCYLTGYSNSFSGLETSIFDADYMFSGAHFKNKDELRFRKFQFVLTDFNLWIGISGFDDIKFNDEFTDISIKYKRPTDFVFEVNDQMSIKFKFNPRIPLGSILSKAQIEQIVEVEIRPTVLDIEIEAFLDWFETFYRFITFAYFKQPVIESITLYVKDTERTGSVPIKLYFKSQASKDTYKKIKTSNLFLFNFSEIKSNFGNILTKWFVMDNLLSPTISGLTESLADKHASIEFIFLNLAQAIESLHRRTIEIDPVKLEIHKQKLNEIIESVPDEYKVWLQRKLVYSYEPTLSDRLNDLAKRLPKRIIKALMKPSKVILIDQIRDCRNYYTHYDKRLEQKALKGSALFDLSEKMKIFLVALVLHHLGFNDDELIKILSEKSGFLFNHVINRNDFKKKTT